MRSCVTCRPTARVVIAAFVALYLWFCLALPAWANYAWGEWREDPQTGQAYCHYQGTCNEETGEGCPTPGDPAVCSM